MRMVVRQGFYCTSLAVLYDVIENVYSLQVISDPINSLLERVVIRDLFRAVSYCVYEC